MWVLRFLMAGMDRTRIDAIGVTAALVIVSEIGSTLSRFPSVS